MIFNSEEEYLAVLQSRRCSLIRDIQERITRKKKLNCPKSQIEPLEILLDTYQNNLCYDEFMDDDDIIRVDDELCDYAKSYFIYVGISKRVDDLNLN